MRWIAAILLAAGGLAGGDGPAPLLVARIGGLMFWPGQELEVPFALRLDAGPPMRVHGIRLLCPCATVGDTPREVNTDHAARFVLRILAPERPMPYGGSADLIGERDGQPARVRCEAAGEVRDFIAWPDASPIFDLGSVPGSALPRVWTLPLPRGRHPERWDAVQVETHGGGEFIVASTALTKDGAEFTVRVAPGLTGSVSAMVQFAFSTAGTISGYRPLRLVRLRIEGPLAAEPAALVFGGLLPGVTDELRTRLVTSDGGDPRIEAVQPSDPARVSASIIEGADGRELSIRLQAGSDPGNASGHVDLTLAGGTVLRVPYLARVVAQPRAPLTSLPWIGAKRSQHWSGPVAGHGRPAIPTTSPP